MKVGVKLFDKNNKVVFEQDTAPEGVGTVSMVVHQGVHYAYRSIMDNSQWRNAPYARFDECDPPLELV